MKKRVITGAVAAVTFLTILWYGKLPFLICVYFLATIGLYELLRMKKVKIGNIISLISFITLWGVLLPEPQKLELLNMTTLEILYTGITLLLAWMVISKNKITFDDISFFVISILYVGMSFYYFYLFREFKGLPYILFILMIIWSTDIGAYFVGKKFGHQKLWESISPNKTIEGFLGGVAGAIIVAIIFYIGKFVAYSLLDCLVLAVLVAIIGSFGDLVQSAIKRHFKVKDSGTILPGHGGILDRFDSIMFTFPFLAIIGVF